MASMNPRGQSQIFTLKGLHHLIMKLFPRNSGEKDGIQTISTTTCLWCQVPAVVITCRWKKI